MHWSLEESFSSAAQKVQKVKQDPRLLYFLGHSKAWLQTQAPQRADRKEMALQQRKIWVRHQGRPALFEDRTDCRGQGQCPVPVPVCVSTWRGLALCGGRGTNLSMTPGYMTSPDLASLGAFYQRACRGQCGTVGKT